MDSVLSNTADVFSLPIVYKGKLADQGELDMADLAESLDGFARIIGCASTYAAGGKDRVRLDSFDVRVTVAAPKSGSFILETAVQFVTQHQMLQGAISTIAGAVIAEVFRGKRDRLNAEQMEHLRAITELAVNMLGRQQEQERAAHVEVVGRLAEAMNPAAKKALGPIGRSCDTIEIGEGRTRLVLTQDDKDALDVEPGDDVDPVKAYDVLFTEMDVQRRTAKVDLDGHENRIACVIADPVLGQPNNAYLAAFASRSRIQVMAKAVIRKGELKTLVVSDTVV